MIGFDKYYLMYERAKSKDKKSKDSDEELDKTLDKWLDKATKYTDQEIEKLKNAGDIPDSNVEETQYTVAPASDGNYVNVVDIKRGNVVARISPRGKIITPPVVQGHTVSFTIELLDGSKLGTIHKLPGGSLINQFRVGPSDAMNLAQTLGTNDVPQSPRTALRFPDEPFYTGRPGEKVPVGHQTGTIAQKVTPTDDAASTRKS